MRPRFHTVIYSFLLLFLFNGCATQPQTKTGTAVKKSGFEIQEATIADIHKAFKAGSCSCEQLVTAYLNRIKTLESQLNEAQDKLHRVQQLVDQQKGVNAELKNQFERMSNAKEELENKLNATLRTVVQAPANP